MIYLSVHIKLFESKSTRNVRRYYPGGYITIVDDDGDAVHTKYNRKKMMELCKTYYQNPEVRIVIDPLVIGASRTVEKYVHQEMGFIVGLAKACGIWFKVIYKRTYYRYFGLNSLVEGQAYNYCIANYPQVSMLYKFQTPEEADLACSAYLATRFIELKDVRKARWHQDLNYIIEELDDGTEEVDYR